MRRKTDLKPEEKQRIVELLSHGKTSLDISKLIHQDHRTVKSFMENSNKMRGRADKGKSRKISRGEISSVKKTVSKNPHSISAKIFHEAGVPSRSRAGRCKILRWLDSLNHGTLYFFCHRIFHSARVKLSLGHCIALLVVFIIGKVLFSYRSYVQRHCCQGQGVEFMQMNL